MLSDGCGNSLPERAEQVRTRLEAVLVEVIARALPRAEDEVALEVRVLAERVLQLVVGQRAERRISRASGSRRAASGEPFESEIMDPSS